MAAAERRVVGVAALLHGLVHGNILAVPVFLDLAWQEEFAAGDVTLGLLAAAAYACFGAGSVPFGVLADRHPAPRLLALCIAGIIASLVLVAASPGLEALAVSLALLGLFSGIYHPTGLSLISRVVREPGRGMGWHGMGGSLGVALGPTAVGGLLALGWSWRAVAAVLALPATAALVLLLVARIEDTGPGTAARPGPGRSLVTRGFLLVLLVYTAAGIAYWGSLTFLPRFVGAGSFAILLGLGAIGQVLTGHLADRSRPSRTLLVLSLAAAALLTGIGLGPAGALLPASWAFGFLLFSLEPLQNTLVTEAVPRDLRGTGFGLTFMSVFGVGSIGAILAGYLLSRGESGVLFAILAAFLVASGVCAFATGLLRLDPGSSGRPPRHT